MKCESTVALQALTSQLAEELSIPIDDSRSDGSIEVIVNDDALIEIHHDPDGGEGFLFSATICETPKQVSASFFAELLHANLLGQGTNGARISLDPELDEIVLCRSFSDPEMPYRRFSEDLHRFIEALLFWRQRSRDGLIGSAEAGAEDDAVPMQGGALKV